MNIVVTGAGGFVGKSLVKRLLEQGNFVYAIVKYESEAEYLIGNNAKTIVVGEQTGYDFIFNEIDKKPDVFYNLAWAGTSGPLRNSEDVQLENIKFACDTINLAIKLKTKRYVFVGSIMEFDTFDFDPMDIKSKNTTFYSLSKYMAHYMTENIAERNDMSYVAAIIGNIYGPGERSKRFVYTMLNRMLKGEEIELSSCEQPYDFVYITDAVEQILAVGQNGRNYESYYIGNSKTKQLKEFVLEMNSIVNKNAILNFGAVNSPVKKDYYKKFDIQKIEREFGVHTKVSFSNGIKATLKWIKEEENE